MTTLRQIIIDAFREEILLPLVKLLMQTNLTKDLGSYKESSQVLMDTLLENVYSL